MRRRLPGGLHPPDSSEEDTDDEMLYIDPDECIDCGACEPACPVTAIFAEDDVPDNMKPYIEINVGLVQRQGRGARQGQEVHG